MSRIPAKETLELIQGSTFDETWEWVEDDGTPTDFSDPDFRAELRIAKDDASAPLIRLRTHDDDGTPITDGDRLELTTGTDADTDPSTVRIYITDETMAARTESEWNRKGNEIKGFQYKGRNTLLFTNADGETTVENDGAVTFQPIVEPVTP